MTETTNGRKFLKVTGILMIVFGGIALVTSIIAAIATGAISAGMASEGMDDGGLGSILNMMSFTAVGGAIIQLVTGILGVSFSKKPEKAMVCLIAGIIVLLMGVASCIIIPLIAQSNAMVAELGIESVFGINWFGMFTSAVLPVLFIIGAVKNKQS